MMFLATQESRRPAVFTSYGGSRHIALVGLLLVRAVRGQAGTCPGGFDIKGYGPVQLTNAAVNIPGYPAGQVDVKADEGLIVARMKGRTYFANTCSDAVYKNDNYVAWSLLGMELRYTTDISGAGCGCNAALYLVSMKQNLNPSQCSDYYCDANSVCGERCAEVDLQEANEHAWHSTLHAAADGGGIAGGFGGNGQRDWTAEEYGPGAKCIDSSKPIDVRLSFPIDPDTGILRAMELHLTQPGKDCGVNASVGKDYEGLAEVSRALRVGMTPVISYWSADDMLWLDGRGYDGKGFCTQDVASACAEHVKFYNFSISSLSHEEAPREEAPAVVRVAEPTASPGAWAFGSLSHEEAPREEAPAVVRVAEPTASPGSSPVLLVPSVPMLPPVLPMLPLLTLPPPLPMAPPATVPPAPPSPTPTPRPTQPPAPAPEPAHEHVEAIVDGLKVVEDDTYEFKGFASSSNARLMCGPSKRLAMPKTTLQMEALADTIRKGVQAGWMSKDWPKDTAWLGGQWSNARQRWEWDDGKEAGHLPGLPDTFKASAKPMLCMVNGEVKDSEPEFEFAVICEPDPDYVPGKCCVDGGSCGGSCRRFVGAEDWCGASPAHCHQSCFAVWCRDEDGPSSDHKFIMRKDAAIQLRPIEDAALSSAAYVGTVALAFAGVLALAVGAAVYIRSPSHGAHQLRLREGEEDRGQIVDVGRRQPTHPPSGASGSWMLLLPSVEFEECP